MLYYINNNSEKNPGANHEVHAEEHAEQLGILDMTSLGDCSTAAEAVSKGKKIYPDADGCAICCSLVDEE